MISLLFEKWGKKICAIVAVSLFNFNFFTQRMRRILNLNYVFFTSCDEEGKGMPMYAVMFEEMSVCHLANIYHFRLDCGHHKYPLMLYFL